MDMKPSVDQKPEIDRKPDISIEDTKPVVNNGGPSTRTRTRKQADSGRVRSQPAPQPKKHRLTARERRAVKQGAGVKKEEEVDGLPFIKQEVP